MDFNDALWSLFLFIFIYPLKNLFDSYLESLKKPGALKSVLEYHTPHFYKAFKYLDNILTNHDRKRN